MMFLLDIAFAVELIALGLGVSMLVWAYRNEGVGIAVAKVFGYIITLAAIFALLCTSYYGTTYWVKGYFASPTAPMQMMMKNMMQEHQGMMQQRKQSLPESSSHSHEQ